MTNIAFRSTNRPGKPNEMDYNERFSEDQTPATGKVK
jgi:hypothetical protein